MLPLFLLNNISCYFSLCDVDIDECEKGTSNCTHKCNNEDGGYFCTCNDGYEIDSDNRTCKGISVITDQYHRAYFSSSLYDFGLGRHDTWCILLYNVMCLCLLL